MTEILPSLQNSTFDLDGVIQYRIKWRYLQQWKKTDENLVEPNTHFYLLGYGS